MSYRVYYIAQGKKRFPKILLHVHTVTHLYNINGNKYIVFCCVFLWLYGINYCTGNNFVFT